MTTFVPLRTVAIASCDSVGNAVTIKALAASLVTRPVEKFAKIVKIAATCAPFNPSLASVVLASTGCVETSDGCGVLAGSCNAGAAEAAAVGVLVFRGKRM